MFYNAKKAQHANKKAIDRNYKEMQYWTKKALKEVNAKIKSTAKNGGHAIIVNKRNIGLLSQEFYLLCTMLEKRGFSVRKNELSADEFFIAW